MEWHGRQKNFGHVLKRWKQNRMAWRVNHFLGTQGHHGPFVALLAFVTLQSIHNGTGVTKLFSGMDAGAIFCNGIHVKPS